MRWPTPVAKGTCEDAIKVGKRGRLEGGGRGTTLRGGINPPEDEGIRAGIEIYYYL